MDDLRRARRILTAGVVAAAAALALPTACGAPETVTQQRPGASAGPTPSATPTLTPTPTPTPTTTPTPTASSTTSAGPTSDPTRAGRALIEAVEERLLDLGYPSGPADGTLGTRTRQAVCAWRDIHHVPGGWPSRLTVAEAEAILDADDHPAADRADGLYITETCQMLLQVRDGRYRRIVRVSTAAPGYSTPNGEGVVWRKWAGWHESSLYPDGWMYDAIYFRRDHPGVALHGSRTNDLVTPYPASHGCARAWRPDIEDIFAETPLGTRVVVYGAYVG